FDDDGYVLAGSPHAEDPSCVELNLEGIGWSDNAVHVVRKGRPNRLDMDTCDVAVAYPLPKGRWYVWLNN
ncbi:MAG: hypothetical protein AAFR54_19585, partial [Planctomycetota bacterium]